MEHFCVKIKTLKHSKEVCPLTWEPQQHLQVMELNLT